MASLSDISKSTGVSISAVSRILNNDTTLKVSKNTRGNVLKVANELKYKTLKQRKNKEQPRILKIGIAQMFSGKKLIEDPYYLLIENCIEEFSAEYDIKTYKLNRNKKIFAFNEDVELDGIFAIGRFDKNEILSLIKINKKIVFIDSSPDDELFYSVVPNYNLGIIQSIHCFLNHWHTKIGFIGEKMTYGDQKIRSIDSRITAFENITKSLNIYHPDFIIECEMNSKSSYEKLKEYLDNTKETPTAFFISSDSMASGVIRAITEKNLKIPKDISLISFNNTLLSEYASIPISSISVHIEEMVVIAIKNMRELFQQESFPTKTIISCSLIERQSVLNID